MFIQWEAAFISLQDTQCMEVLFLLMLCKARRTRCRAKGTTNLPFLSFFWWCANWQSAAVRKQGGSWLRGAFHKTCPQDQLQELNRRRCCTAAPHMEAVGVHGADQETMQEIKPPIGLVKQGLQTRRFAVGDNEP